jgi:hypothetical protein
MNKIVKRHVPVNELPKDWQSELPQHAYVDVEIKLESGRDGETGIASLVASARNVHGKEADMLAHIETIRDDR